MVVVVVVVVVVVDVVVAVVVVGEDAPAEATCILTLMEFEAANPLESVAVTFIVCSPVSRKVIDGLSPVEVFCVVGPMVCQVRVTGSVPPEKTALYVTSDSGSPSPSWTNITIAPSTGDVIRT